MHFPVILGWEHKEGQLVGGWGLFGALPGGSQTVRISLFQSTRARQRCHVGRAYGGAGPTAVTFGDTQVLPPCQQPWLAQPRLILYDVASGSLVAQLATCPLLVPHLWHWRGWA